MTAQEEAARTVIEAELSRYALRRSYWFLPQLSDARAEVIRQIAEIEERLPVLWEKCRVERYNRKYLAERKHSRQVHWRKRTKYD